MRRTSVSRPGERSGSRWPTVVKPVCTSKEEYQELLEKHVEELSSLQHFTTPRTAMQLLIFQGMDGAGKDGAIRHVMSGVNPKAAKCSVSSSRAPKNCNTIFSGARPPASRKGADRHFQSFLLRRSAGGSSTSRDSPQPGTS